jgi:N-acylneuraminate cytidylyltransferase
MAYSITAALESGIFARVVVSTDSGEYAAIARYYGAEMPFIRPVEFAGDGSPDIEWVQYTLSNLQKDGHSYDCFSILRPTSPFRQAATIRRAWRQFLSGGPADSLRAVEKCRQHPGKMWIIQGQTMEPLLPQPSSGQPWHSMQYQSLPEVYVQNASLEIAWTRVAMEGGTIAGKIVMPFFTDGYEGYDINQPTDWQLAESLLADGQARLPKVSYPTYPGGEA